MATTYQDTTGKYFNTQAEAARSNTALGTNPQTAIPVSTLTTSPTPLQIAPTITPTLSSQGLNEFEAGAIQTQVAGQAEDLAMAEAEKKYGAQNKLMLSRLQSDISGQRGETGLTSEAYGTDLGLGTTVDTASKELKDINNQILAKSTSYRRQIEQTRLNPEGKFGGAVEQDVRNLERKGNAELADLSIIQMAKSNNYTGAKEIADRKVSAFMEQQNIALENAKFFYQENKEQLTKQENRDFATLLADRERAIAKETKTLEDVNTVGIEAAKNGADTATIQKILGSKTTAEAIANAGTSLQTTNLQSVKGDDGQFYNFNPITGEYKASGFGMINPTGADTVNIPGVGTVNGNAAALAQAYMTTGKLPSPADLKAAGTTFSEVTKIAKESPKFEGALVDRNTGVKSSTVSPTQEDGIAALKDLTQRLDLLKTTYNETGFFSNEAQRQKYVDYSAEIVDLLARARTGAVINDEEAAAYQAKIPQLFGLTKGSIFGANTPSVGNQKIDDLKKSLEGKLQTVLSSNNLSIYGYSKVIIGGKEYKVGDTIDNGSGIKGVVTPDGQIMTPNNQVSTNSGSTRAVRNNNPLNIKSSPFTQSFSGVSGIDKSPASDGGSFLTFNSPEAGFQAAERLITSPNYTKLSVDSALKRWSNSGYGSEIVPELKGKTIGQLTSSQLAKLIKKMATREGYTV